MVDMVWKLGNEADTILVTAAGNSELLSPMCRGTQAPALLWPAAPPDGTRSSFCSFCAGYRSGDAVPVYPASDSTILDNVITGALPSPLAPPLPLCCRCRCRGTVRAKLPHAFCSTPPPKMHLQWQPLMLTNPWPHGATGA